MSASAPDQTDMSLEHRCRERLAAFRARLTDEPRYNPVAQLSFELSRDLEAGTVSRQDLTCLIHSLGKASFKARARALADYVGPLDMDENRKRLKSAIKSLLGDAGTFEEDLAVLRRCQLGLVFTAHPTFLLSRCQRNMLARLANDEIIEDDETGFGPDRPITLNDEHEAVLLALDRASDAIAEFSKTSIEILRKRHGGRWREAQIGFVSVGTWVGYDLDGRTDIAWIDMFRFRLAEKSRQIRRYEASINRILLRPGCGSATESRLRQMALKLYRLQAWSDLVLEAFSQSPLDPSALETASEILTTNHPDRIVSITPLLSMLDEAIADASDEIAIDLLVLRNEMAALGFGVGEVHLRINATQLHNAIMQYLDLDSEEQIGSRSILEKLGELIRNADKYQVNFASLDIEQKTALRQFLLAAQILKHVDSGSSIRLLIAECESPATVLAAMCFARLCGVDHRLDISPLFETPAALEGAARFFDVLFTIPEYRDIVRVRGRIAIQTGFSDSGRFMGQIPAALAIERVQGQLARACTRHELTDVEVLIFNTHGESAGRGTHQRSFMDRAFYVLSPWIRHQYRDAGIALKHEVSFQGGDGYLYFETPELALATLTRLVECEVPPRCVPDDDALYAKTSFSFDFYRRIANFHDHLLNDRAYHRTLGSFPQGLLNETGSRKSRRQFDVAGAEVHQVRKIRAIPHNAILQQLGYPLTVVSGFGSAVRDDEDRFVEVYRGSDRLRRLTSHVFATKQKSSIKALAAFATIYDPAFWSSRPYAGAEPHLAVPCLLITQLLEGDERATAISALAVKLRIDAIWLHRIFDAVELPSGKPQEPGYERSDMLQAIRLALLQHIFLMAARVPRFSTRNDISRDDIMELIFSLRIPEAVELLHGAYPGNPVDMKNYHLSEPFTYPGERPSNYADLSARLIDPIADTYAAILEAGTALALDFGAHG